jgi:hypothetical protein
MRTINERVVVMFVVSVVTSLLLAACSTNSTGNSATATLAAAALTPDPSASAVPATPTDSRGTEQPLTASYLCQTPLPYPPIKPVSTPDIVASKAVNNVIFATNGEADCKLPCWHGLHIDQSGRADIQRVFDTTFGFDGSVDFFSADRICQPNILGTPPEGIEYTGYPWNFKNKSGAFGVYAAITEDAGVLKGLEFVYADPSNYKVRTNQQIIQKMGTPDYIYGRVGKNGFEGDIFVNLILIYKQGVVFWSGYHLIGRSQNPNAVELSAKLCLNESIETGGDYIVGPLNDLMIESLTSLQKRWLSFYFESPYGTVENVFGLTVNELAHIALQDEPCLQVVAKE